MPSRRFSRPKPEPRTPPNGSALARYARPKSFTTVEPATRRAPMRRPRRASRVNTVEPSPKSVALAMRTASSSSRTRSTQATGPNVSSRAIAMSGVTSTSTVG